VCVYTRTHTPYIQASPTPALDTCHTHTKPWARQDLASDVRSTAIAMRRALTTSGRVVSESEESRGCGRADCAVVSRLHTSAGPMPLLEAARMVERFRLAVVEALLTGFVGCDKAGGASEGR